MLKPDWKLVYASRPEHCYVGPRRCGKTSIVEALRSYGYWAYEHTTESGDQIARIYSAQRRLHEADLSAKTQPRMFFSDTAWWLFQSRFHYVNPHLVANISFPESELETLLPGRDINWLYLWGADARERLLPELAIAVSEAEATGGPAAARKTSAAFLERVYPELVPVLAYCLPQQLSSRPYLLMERATFESRVRSFRQRYALPDKLKAQELSEYLMALGFCEYTNKYYLRFAKAFAVGLMELKNTLTHAGIQARMKA